MRSVVSVGFLGLLFFTRLAGAQIAKPVIELHLDGKPRPLPISTRALLYSPQCGSSSDVYVRYSPPNDDGQGSTLARVQTDGEIHNLPPVSLSDARPDSPVLLFAAGDDGSLHQVIRVLDQPDTQETGDDVRYVSFDSDGELRSQPSFGDTFLPATLLPLPSGDFFAAGTVLKHSDEGWVEHPLAGIFGPDAQLKNPVKKTESELAGADAWAQEDSNDRSESTLESAIPRLGGDGNIYLLLPGDTARVTVISPAGRMLREMKLPEPFKNGFANDMWVSGGRLLVVYEGPAGGPQNATLYVVYDAQTGEVIRQYHPEFSGTAACFQDGQTLTVLVRQASLGNMAIGTAELE